MEPPDSRLAVSAVTRPATARPANEKACCQFPDGGLGFALDQQFGGESDDRCCRPSDLMPRKLSRLVPVLECRIAPSIRVQGWVCGTVGTLCPATMSTAPRVTSLAATVGTFVGTKTARCQFPDGGLCFDFSRSASTMYVVSTTSPRPAGTSLSC